MSSIRRRLPARVIDRCDGATCSTWQRVEPRHHDRSVCRRGVRFGRCRSGRRRRRGLGLKPWLGVDGNLTWLKTFGDSEAFTTALNARAHFLTNRAVSPVRPAGFGLYRTSFNSASVDVPDFYRRRTTDASPGYDSLYRFTDPAWVFGSGLTIFRSRHVAIHPAAEAIVVRRDAQSYVVTSGPFTRYLFELDPSPPSGSRRIGL